MTRRLPPCSDLRSLPFWMLPLLAALAWLAAPLRAADLDERLRPLIAAHEGEVSVAVEHLKTGESFRQAADVPRPTASLIKLPVMIEAYRQAEREGLDLDALVTLEEEDKVPGSGILTPHFSDGARLPLRDLIRLMIAYSDNTATNLVVGEIGLEATAETMERLGFPETKLHSLVYRRDTSIFPERSRRFGLGSTTAEDMIALLRLIERRELLSPVACDEIYEHLLNCQDEDLFKRYLPDEVRVAHKTGAVSDVRTSAGILETPSGPVALCVLTSRNADRRWTKDNRAEVLIAEVAREVFHHFNRLPESDADADDAEALETLRIGDDGSEVEDLQRRLNVALEPSPQLAIDGAFGPLTEAALIRFQKARGLSATGIADRPTRLALLEVELPDREEEERSVPPPEQVNARELEYDPPDPLGGPPFVTAKAWVAIDGESGTVLGGDNETQPLDMASTTKIMTAHVVLQLAEEDPEVLDEVVTFSERADRTIGSSARVRAGERLSVRELLYGLLLPSGNDASVALGEHFGHRLREAQAGGDEDEDDEQEDESKNLDPYTSFVAAMNREAEALGLDNTRFENTHGLTAAEHKASALDLARLAAAALKNPLFAEIVSTRQHGCTLIDMSADRRNVIWRNTNRLLRIEGYDGVKTGTTSAAGACLVSSGRRDGRHVILCVLGSASTDARYADSRNLFRWAWNTVLDGAGK